MQGGGETPAPSRDVSYEMSWRRRLSGHYWQERPGAHNSRGKTAQPPLRNETGPDNATWPVFQGRGVREGRFPTAMTVSIFQTKQRRFLLSISISEAHKFKLFLKQKRSQ